MVMHIETDNLSLFFRIVILRPKRMHRNRSHSPVHQSKDVSYKILFEKHLRHLAKTPSPCKELMCGSFGNVTFHIVSGRLKGCD